MIGRDDTAAARLVADALAAHGDGRLPNLDQIARITNSTVTDGAAAGSRLVDLWSLGGWHVQVWPDRGLDIGAAAVAGMPISWTSAVGPAAPIDDPSGDSWLHAFSGGLVTTCGLQNVGAPSEGYGLHGRYSHLRADEVRVERRLFDDSVTLEVSGTVNEVSALGPHLQLTRHLRLDVATATLELRDTTVNLGDEVVAAPLLYHVNVGVPLWSGAARLQVSADGVEPRDAASEEGLGVWDRPPPVAPSAEEWVFEHSPSPDADGWAHAQIDQPSMGCRIRCSWETAALPRLHQWSHRRAGVYALAIEPANCSTSGRAADRAAGRLPTLSPGEARVTRLRVAASSL